MDRYDAARRRQARPGRSALGYWLPLVVTVTIATAGLAAWIWSERQQDDHDNHDDDRPDDQEDDKYDHPLDYPEHLPDQQTLPAGSGDRGFLARMTDRTPSPQQFFDRTGQRIRAAVGLSGEGRQQERAEPAFSDSEHWNEEAESKRSQRPTTSNKPKRSIAIVLSANNDNQQDHEAVYRTEHAVSPGLTISMTGMKANLTQSILSHLPEDIDPAITNLFILIYAPDLKSLPALPTASASTTLSSSYASVSYPGSSSPDQPSSSMFDSLWQKSHSLVDKPSQVLPFSTPTGYIHILRHLSPSLVYLTDSPSLSGHHGENIQQLKGWVGQTILVVGDDGAGGLVDTETETEDETSRRKKSNQDRSDKWWETSDSVGLGKDVEVVDIGRMNEDWWRRVGVSN